MDLLESMREEWLKFRMEGKPVNPELLELMYHSNNGILQYTGDSKLAVGVFVEENVLIVDFLENTTEGLRLTNCRGVHVNNSNAIRLKTMIELAEHEDAYIDDEFDNEGYV